MLERRGGEVAAVLEREVAAALGRVDVSALSREQKLDVLRACEANDARNAALRHAVLDDLHATYPPDRQGNFTAEEVACELGVTPATARGRLAVAEELTSRLQDTWQLMADGRLADFKARCLAGAVAGLSDEETALVQGYVLQRAHFPYGRFRRVVDHAVELYAPKDPETARKAAAEERTVFYIPDENETATLVIKGPMSPLAVTWAAIRDHADQSRQPGDTRTVEQARFDSFNSLTLGGDDVWEKVTPQVEVVAPLDALQGGSTPGELVGHGPISAATVRQLAGTKTAVWRRTVYDPGTGHLVAAGTHKYRPGDVEGILTRAVEEMPAVEAARFASALLSRYVKARNLRCVAPHCHRRAKYADLDHTIPWSQLGVTGPWNLRPLCPRHHTMKDFANGWGLKDNHDGSVTWRTPTGREYTVQPHDYRGP